MRTSYDPAGRPIKVEHGELAAWQSESVAPSAWSGFTVFRTAETQYDSMGRKVRESLREGSAGPVRALTQHSYDPLGRLECTAVRMNPAAFASPPASACALGPQGSDGPDRITKNVHDLAGQLLTVKKAVGTPIQQDYVRYEYTLTGRQKAVIDANANRAELRYDGHDRQERWVFPSKTAAGQVNEADYEAYGYDPAGNRTSVRKRDGTTLLAGCEDSAAAAARQRLWSQAASERRSR